MRCASLLGLSAQRLRDDEAGQVVIAVARPTWQRLSRCLLFVGLGIALFWTGSAWLVARPVSSATLLLGQPTPLTGNGPVLTLNEVFVVPSGGETPRVLSAQLTAQCGEAVRPVTLRSGRGASLRQWHLRLVSTRKAASVRVEQANGHAADVYSVDGPRTVGKRARVFFTTQQEEQLVAAPQANLVIRLASYTGQSDAHQGLSAELLDGQSGAVLAQTIVESTATLAARGYRAVVTPEVAIEVQAEPLLKRIILIAAITMAGIGAAAQIVWPGRRAWFGVEASGAIWLLGTQHAPWDRHWVRRLIATIDVGSQPASQSLSAI